MPDLNLLLNAQKIKPEEPSAKKKFSRGIRPDHIARGEFLQTSEDTALSKLNTNERTDSETDNKLETKWQQTDSKTDNKLETKWQQTDSKTDFKKVENTKTDNKPSTQLATQVETKWQQTDNKVATNVHFSSLVGLQKEITFFIYNQCKISRSKETGAITLGFITSFVKTSENSAKVTIQRLEKKHVLKRVESKNGRGGWARFELSDNIYRELLQNETDNKLETKWQQTDSKPSTQLATEVATSSPIVVVSSNSTNTTNTETQNPDAPCFVIPIELTGKVSRKQLLEFVNSGIISEYDLQLSLDAFAYDLKNKLISVKHASNPVALLIGAIKNNGSYNSAKYIEVLKTELKPFIQEQREVSEIKQEQKSSKDWEEFLKFKLELPEDYKKLEAKAAQIGFTGDILQEFTFLEFKKVILKINDEEFANPLRPPLVLNP